MFKRLLERIALILAPHLRPSTVVERITPWAIYGNTTSGTSTGIRFTWEGTE